MAFKISIPIEFLQFSALAIENFPWMRFKFSVSVLNTFFADEIIDNNLEIISLFGFYYDDSIVSSSIYMIEFILIIYNGVNLFKVYYFLLYAWELL